ncbi:HAD family hydrolase [Planctomyces sp. SH-PL62]|uniref:HAD family hydrolase n=1 Tax=Planctomyces sp. SH-PL62 TaxID=1636152 RepID=UPI00078BB42A|nr:HAD family phosphatase [Planctomyces sp. SH-PL62]AMV39025.1 Beta-phosphoglucomutase [Planctomyces sp. SH-PL62]
MISAVIFDFNGVIVDDESVHFDLFREILEQEGVIITYQDYHDRYLGYDDAGCFEHVLEDAGQAYDSARIADMIARKGVRYFEVADQGLKFFPDAAETIRRLAEQYPVAINSGALRAEIVYSLERLGLRDRISAIVAAEDAFRCKPDPSGYVQALEALRANRPELNAADCMVIEDSLAGIISAKGAGMKAVGITQTYPADELTRSGADAVIDGLAELTRPWIDATFADVTAR